MSNYGVLEEDGEKITDIKPESEPCFVLRRSDASS